MFLYNKNQVYESKYFLYQYNDTDFRIVHQKYCRKKGFEDLFKTKRIESESERCSLSRTKRNIRELALCNNFTHFATLTVNSQFADRFSLENCQENLRKIFKKIKRKNSDFKYLFITEKHKNGAFHFHGLVSGLDFYTNQNGYLSNSDLDNLGFNSFSVIKDYSKCCNYITKYITKDCIKNEHNQIYISSRGLKKATRTEISNFPFEFNFENDFVRIKDFQIDNLSNAEKIFLLREDFR